MPTRRKPQLAVSRAIALLAVLTATAVPRASFATAEADWFPLHAGARWIYETHRDLTLRPEKATLKRLLYVGRSTWIAEPAPDRFGSGLLIRQTSVQAPLEGAGIKTTETDWEVYSFGSELLLRASGGTSEGVKRPEVIYTPPLRLLPTTTTGDTWNAGTFRQGDQSADLHGQVIGTKDLGGEPSWSGCLEVQFKGDISGTLMVSDVQTQIESGHYERLVYFARGVGIVRDVTTVTSLVKLPDGRRAEIVQVSSERLVEYLPSK